MLMEPEKGVPVSRPTPEYACTPPPLLLPLGKSEEGQEMVGKEVRGRLEEEPCPNRLQGWRPARPSSPD